MSAHVDAPLASWSHVGSILAPTWPSWLQLGAMLAPTSPSWFQLGHLGAFLGYVRLRLDAFGLILSALGTPEVVKNCRVFEVFQDTRICLPMFAYLGLWWRIFAYLGAILAPSWAPT